MSMKGKGEFIWSDQIEFEYLKQMLTNISSLNLSDVQKHFVIMLLKILIS